MASPTTMSPIVAVRGEVRDGTIDNNTMTFILKVEASLTVRFTDAMVSNGLDDNRTVYAEGILRHEDEAYVFDATIIKTHAHQSMKKQRATRITTCAALI